MLRKLFDVCRKSSPAFWFLNYERHLTLFWFFMLVVLLFVFWFPICVAFLLKVFEMTDEKNNDDGVFPFFAFGSGIVPRGLISLGSMPTGVVAIGLLPIGLFALGPIVSFGAIVSGAMLFTCSTGFAFAQLIAIGSFPVSMVMSIGVINSASWVFGGWSGFFGESALIARSPTLVPGAIPGFNGTAANDPDCEAVLIDPEDLGGTVVASILIYAGFALFCLAATCACRSGYRAKAKLAGYPFGEGVAVYGVDAYCSCFMAIYWAVAAIAFIVVNSRLNSGALKREQIALDVFGCYAPPGTDYWDFSPE